MQIVALERICFQGEKAVDVGAYCPHFGMRRIVSYLMVEVYLAQLKQMSHFTILGTTLSHGNLSSGFLPARVSLLSLAIVLFG